MSGEDNKKPFRVGLTGGIASGKSTVANMFANLGVPIIDTDVISREVTEPGQPALKEIRDRFGDHVIDSHGRLKRRALREIIFDDGDARKDLESILHPRIQTETQRQAQSANGPYQLIVVPLLLGSSLLDFLDRVLVVDCDEATQISRLMARDTETLEQAQNILAAQASRPQRLEIADDIIRNDRDIAETLDHVTQLNSLYRHLSQLRCSNEQSSETP